MKNIVLIGFMGTGKTRVGRLLAGRLKCSFIDIDKRIEIQSRMTVAEIFEQQGEAYFRQKEQETIARIARRQDRVIATGGGVVLRAENMDRLRETGLIVSLTASLETVLERTGRKNTRPLLNLPDRAKVVAELMEKRAGLYQQADFIVDTDHLSPQQTVEKIIAFLRREGYKNV